MISDAKRIYDGFDNLAGGVDFGRRADAIAREQCVSAQNMIFRGGLATVRPGIRKLTWNVLNNIEYDVSGGHSGIGSQTGSTGVLVLVDAYPFQGACVYTRPDGQNSIMAMIGGRLFEWVPKGDNTADVTEIYLDNANNRLLPIAYMIQADRFLIIQDGSSKAIIFDGAVARRATETEVPVGTLMAYGMGRLCLAVNDTEIVIGDIYGSHDDPGASILQFTETLFLSEGGATRIPSAFGKIKAMAFVPQQDSATGDGELTVYGERGETSLFLSQPRDQWKQSAFQRVGLLNSGAVSQRSLVSKNGDLWFRSEDGFRSYRQARSEIQGWAHLPMSTEVRQYTENDCPELLYLGSAIEFNNLLIATCSPAANNGKPFHYGMLVLDFDVLSSFGNATRPAWCGHWQKMRVLQLVKGTFKGTQRAFAFGLNTNDYVIQLFELSTSDQRDFDGPITWELVGRDLLFDSPYNEKTLYGGDVWVDEVTDPVTIQASYRPDQLPDWVTWQTLPTINPVGTPGLVTLGGVPTIRKGFRPRQTLEKPNVGSDDANTKRNLRRGYSFQPRLQGTGHCTIRKFRAHAIVETEDSKART